MLAHHSTDIIFHARSSEQHLPESAPCGLLIHYANAGQLQAAYKGVSPNGSSQMLLAWLVGRKWQQRPPSSQQSLLTHQQLESAEEAAGC